MNGILHMVQEILGSLDPERNSQVTHDQYLEWARGFIFDGLRNQRYGQSFCNHFGITDKILFFQPDYQKADAYIRENYLK